MGGLVLATASSGTYQEVIEVLTGTLSDTALTSLLAYVATTCVGLCLLWFSIRKISGALMRAFKRGKLRL